jgi:sugar O-acyltransferase (sialic acid O-acetyltransferase NeuD family)
MSKKLLVFGGSGHAKDVISAAESLGYERFAVVTTDGSSNIDALSAVKEADFRPADYRGWHGIAAIGNNEHRQRFYEKYSADLEFVSILSPAAAIASSAVIGSGSYIGAFAYVGPDAVIGRACIVNTHSIVGHDAKVGDFTHVGPRVCLSGHVELGKKVFIGAGANFNNGSFETPLRVPDGVNVGMGCQVTESIRHENIRLIPKPNYIAARS